MIEPPDPLPKKPEGFGEPAVVELADGTLWMVFRSIFGELWQCQSRDGGLAWGPPSSLNVWGPRMPLAIAVSHDGCRTWSCPTIIDERKSVYANLHFSDNELFVLYEFQSPGATKYQTGLAVYTL